MKNFLNILSVFVLMMGVIAGSVLVQNEQDIRNSAAPEDKVQICHKTGNGDEFKKIEIAEQAIQSHLDHGDKLSGCDEPASTDASQDMAPVQVQEQTQVVTQTSAPITPTVAPTETVQPLQTEIPNTEATSNSSSSSNSNANSDVAPVTVNTNTFVSPVNSNVFNFKFKVQNITRSGVTKNVTLTFYKSGNQMVRNLTATSGENGIFSGSISGLDQGDYEVVLKVDSYLANRFTGVNISTSDSTWDWTSSRFKGVDFNHDNILNIVDVGMILAVYNQRSVPVTASNSMYDVNSDNVINEADIDIVLSYYTSLVVTGEF